MAVMNLFDFIKYNCRELQRTLTKAGTSAELAESVATDLARATGEAMKAVGWHGPGIEKLAEGEYKP